MGPRPREIVGVLTLNFRLETDTDLPPTASCIEVARVSALGTIRTQQAEYVLPDEVTYSLPSDSPILGLLSP
jgi:hypothetical protein